MLNKNTRTVLKNLNTIGNSAIIRYPYTSIIQPDKTLISFIDMEALGEEEFDEFGIYFLSEFLSLVDLYDDGEVRREGNIIELENSYSTQKYETPDLEIMKIFDVPSAVLGKLLSSEIEVSFDLGTEQLSRIKKVASLLKLKSMIVDAKTENEEMKLVACNLSENDSYMQESVNDVPIGIVNVDTKVVFDIQNILKIPDADYKVRIIKNQDTGNYISLWEAENEPFSIIVTLQKSLLN